MLGTSPNLLLFCRFDTTGTKLTFADQYIEITTSLPTNYIYGLGEHRDRLLHDVSKGFSMSTWARDQPPAGCVSIIITAALETYYLVVVLVSHCN